MTNLLTALLHRIFRSYLLKTCDLPYAAVNSKRSRLHYRSLTISFKTFLSYTRTSVCKPVHHCLSSVLPVIRSIPVTCYRLQPLPFTINPATELLSSVKILIRNCILSGNSKQGKKWENYSGQSQKDQNT